MERLERFYRQVPNRAATIAVAFSKDRFREQAWVDVRTERWQKRRERGRQARKNQGRAILVKSGRLKRSVRKIRVGSNVAVIGTDVPYAAIHNYGGKITTRKARGQRVRSSDDKPAPNATMPRRQFLGESQVLARRIERDMASQVLKVLREP